MSKPYASLYMPLYIAIQEGITVVVLIRCGDYEIHAIRASIWNRLGKGKVETKRTYCDGFTLLTITPL